MHKEKIMDVCIWIKQERHGFEYLLADEYYFYDFSSETHL